MQFHNTPSKVYKTWFKVQANFKLYDGSRRIYTNEEKTEIRQWTRCANYKKENILNEQQGLNK